MSVIVIIYQTLQLLALPLAPKYPVLKIENTWCRKIHDHPFSSSWLQNESFLLVHKRKPIGCSKCSRNNKSLPYAMACLRDGVGRLLFGPDFEVDNIYQ